MKRKWSVIMAAVCCMLLTACSEEISDTRKINDILQEERYLKVTLEESYHQEAVLFDLENDRAVVPKGLEWGLPKYRDGAETGANYGEEESVDIYESDREADPELYVESYLGSIQKLNLTVGDVKDSGYAVKVVEHEQLALFEEELAVLSGIVLDDVYELVGVEVSFDKKFRPVEKRFQLEKIDNTNLEDEEEDSEDCTQKISCDVGKFRFGWAFHRVKKSIEKMY